MKKSILTIIIIALVAAAAWFLYFQPQNATAPTSTNNISGNVVIEDKRSILEEESKNITEYSDINVADAYKLITETDPTTIVIDVSPKYDEGHIAQAVNYPISDNSLDEAIPNLDKEKTYLVYCHVDSAAIAGAEKLTMAGFQKVYRLEGNYDAWYKGGYPIEIPLQAVSPYSGTAIANRSFLRNTFTHEIEANLTSPAEGKFYEGWLVKGSEFFSTGKLEKNGAKFTLKYTSDTDSRDYTEVVITEETESQGLDNNPEAHVLEGEFI